MADTLVHDGTWPPVIAWLNEIAGGRFSIPFGRRPPITMNGDGDLVVTNRSGTSTAQIGDTVVVDRETGEFHVRGGRHG